MTPEEAAVSEIERILKGADPAGVLAEAGTLAMAWGVSPEDFQLALGVSGATAPENSLRDFLIALAGRNPNAVQTMANIGFYATDPLTGRLMTMREIGAELAMRTRFFGRNVKLAILETIFGDGVTTAIGLMELATDEAA